MIAEISYKLIRFVVTTLTLVVFCTSSGLSFASSETFSEFEREKIEVEEFVVRISDRVDRRAMRTDRIKILPHCAFYRVEAGNAAELPTNFFFEHSARNGIGRPLTT